MTQTELAQIRQRLEAERMDLHAQLDAFLIDNQDQDTDYGSGHHYGDDATELFLRERNIPLRNSIQQRIEQIDAALRRLEEGSYGSCARCGQPINPERLEALPHAILCIGCQSLVERG